MQTLTQNNHTDIVFPGSPMERVGLTTDFPYNGVARLQLQFGNAAGHGTGTLIGDRYVLTAAHNLFNTTYGDVRDITIVPGQNGVFWPFGHYKPKRWFLLEEYKRAPVPYRMADGSIDVTRYLYDYALIELEQLVGMDKYLFPFAANARTLRHGSATIIGYPGNQEPGTMWKAENSVHVNPDDGEFLFYRISTEGGDSGAGVLKEIDGDLRITGIHVAGVPELETNFGVRITEEVCQQILGWMEMK